MMKYLPAVLRLGLVAGSMTALIAIASADDKKPKPYPLKTCVVSDEKLDEDPNMKPHVFIHAGREIKLCCKPCLKDFNKDTAKYIAKIEAAEKKGK